MSDVAASVVRVWADSTDKAVRARYELPAEAEEGNGPPDRAALMAALEAQGWAHARLDESAIAAFLLACHRDGAPAEAVIGELVDGYFEIDIDADSLTVRLTLWPPEGGRVVQPDDVRIVLAGRGIKLPVDEAALAEAFAAGRCDDLPIVHGTAPTPGTPARFVNLLEPRRGGADDDHARIDLRDLGNLLLVQPGTHLMRRIPAVQGTPGQDVFGRVLPAPEVADTPFTDRLTGVGPDADDPDLLVATVAGLPSVRARGVSVNPVVAVDAVDMHSGNIAFEGTLRVNGDIKTGMSVRVGGDVIVAGTIEAAHVEAGGNVVVSGGIIGKSDGPHDPASAIARIQCKGSVHARFIENAVVEAGTTVTADSAIRQSDVAAGETITAGDAAIGSGNITGGRCRAWHAVRAGTLGAPAGTATAIHVGLNPYADAEKAALEAEKRRQEQEQAKIQQLMAFFAKNPERATPELREKARATLFKYTRDIMDTDAHLAKLAEQLHPRPDAAVVVGKKVHGGVSVTIGQKAMRVMEDMPKVELRLVGEGIGVVRE